MATIYGTKNADDLAGDVTDDYISGGPAANEASDKGGDTFSGGGGADTMVGWGGDDVFYVDGSSLAQVIGGKGGDAVFANGVTDMRGWVIDLGAGYDGIDFIQGTLVLDGTDQFIGVELMDTWNTVFTGTEAANTFDFRGIYTTAFFTDWSVTVAGERGNDRIWGGIVGDALDGGAGKDKLYGMAGDDLIDGGGGKDVLDGGAGTDVLTGGTGNDSFVFSVLDGAVDVVTDFAPGADRIQVSAAALGGLLPVGALAAGAFAIDAPTAAGPQFVFDSGTATLAFDADGTGDGVAVGVLTLGNAASLSAADITII